MSWWIIHFGMFLSVTQWSDRCVPWQILFVGVFVWALAPFVCLVCCSSLTKRKSGWGICGSSGWSVWFLVCCDLPAFPDLLGLCTNDVFTAYAHVRTEPQCDIGHTRGKKNRQKSEKMPRRYTSCAGSQSKSFTWFLCTFQCSFGCRRLVGCCSRFCCCLAAISLMWLLGVSWWVS